MSADDGFRAVRPGDPGYPPSIAAPSPAIRPPAPEPPASSERERDPGDDSDDIARDTAAERIERIAARAMLIAQRQIKEEEDLAAEFGPQPDSPPFMTKPQRRRAEERNGGAPPEDGPWTPDEEKIAARVAAVGGGELADVLDQLDEGLDQLRGAHKARRPAKRPLPEVLASIREAQARLVSGPAAEKDLRRIIREAREAEQLQAPPRVPPAYACAFQNATAVQRVRTGFPTLDALCRGAGLELGRVQAVSGPPNIGKTAFVVQLGCAFARTDCVVLFHVADVDRRADVATRIGVAHGIPLADLEVRSPAALAEAEALLRKTYPLLTIVDQRADRMMVEDSIAMLRAIGRRNPGLPLVLAVDSIQKAKLRAMAAGGRTMLDKERADAVLEVLADGADAGMMVLATSEVPRDFYSGRTGENRNDMAAFKSSGSIEYALTTGIVLRPLPGEDNAVRAGVCKNKRAKEGAVKLLMDPDRGTFLDGGPLEYDGGPPGARTKRPRDNGPELHAPPVVPKKAARARRLLEEDGPFPSKLAWRAAIGGNMGDRLEAMAYCVKEEWAYQAPGPDGAKGWWHYRAPTAAAPNEIPRCLLCNKPSHPGPCPR